MMNMDMFDAFFMVWFSGGGDFKVFFIHKKDTKARISVFSGLRHFTTNVQAITSISSRSTEYG